MNKLYTLFLVTNLLIYGIEMMGQNPNWNPPNAMDYNFSASVIAEIYVDSTLTNSTMDSIAFFVDGELRGLSVPIDVGMNVIKHFTTIYSNESVDTMDIIVYHNGTNATYMAPTPLIFGVQNIYGSIDQPFEIHVYTSGDAPISILDIPDQITLEGKSFDTLDLSLYLDQIEDQEVTWTYVPNDSLDIEINGSHLMVSGVENFTGTTFLEIFATDVSAQQNTASKTISFKVIPLFPSPEWNNLPGQAIVKGEQFDTIALHDFEMSYEGDSILYTCLPIIDESDDMDNDPLWSFSGDFPTNMTLVARVDFTPYYRLNTPLDRIAAFVDGEIRGVSSVDEITGLYFLTIAGNTNEDQEVEIRFYSSERKKIYVEVLKFDYVPHGISGNVDDPTCIDLAPIIPLFPDSLVAGGIVDIPIEIADTSFIGTQRFHFIAQDPIWSTCVNDTATVSFCISEDSTGLTLWYQDVDGDGLGNSEFPIYACDSIAGYVSNKLDCDDLSIVDSFAVITILENSALFNDDGFVCSGDEVLLTVANSASIQWSTGSIDDTISISPTADMVLNAIVTYSSGCVSTDSIEIIVEGTVVVDSMDYKNGSLRSVLSCAEEGHVLFFDQPIITKSIINSPIIIDKSLEIRGLNSTNRPQIHFNAHATPLGFSLNENVILELRDVDVNVEVNETPTTTFQTTVGPGSLSISGITNYKEE